ncbi:hypothetical protein OEZ60_13075 [Defluviimonas sp. WL0024]|uniref:DNA-directed RNA polymerase specialized sigma subunit, sigma24 family n=1 Tax=Albidovulum salinarum TaxID=2984153 RepID=A0ABT2X4R3_9RHOB|nr:hypothetical protein [Defluviimonas sp. WL0024]MCU9848937.1 hypothetical protein [Defluviimonas sp. WL0024]
MDRLTRIRQFEDEFREICGRHPDLGAWSEPGSLTAMLHGPGDAGDKNRVLRALVSIAQDGDSPHRVAQVVLILALWPGLDAVYRRHRARFRSDPAALASDLLADVAEGILRLHLDRVQWIAATLLRNTERDLCRQEIALRKRQMELCDVTDAVIAKSVDSARIPSVEVVNDDPRTEALSRLMKTLPPEDVGMLIAVAVLGETQRQAAERFGIGYEAARKRYQRTRDRLRAELDRA